MYLGIDLGTSGVKVLLMDENQRVLGSATGALTVSRPHAGWAEQAPADWIAATRAALNELRASHDLSGVKGIGLSGQMHGAVTLDADDQVIRPAILWNDTRSHVQAARLDAMPEFRAITGNIVFPGFTAPKLVWMAENEPEAFACVDCVLLPKDYLRLWLTGERVAEMSDAAGTSWLDTGARAWSDKLLTASGMRRDQMPALIEGSENSGGLRPDVAAEFGMDWRVAHDAFVAHAAQVLPEQPPPVTVLGVDETRRGKAHYETDPTTGAKTWVDRFDTGLVDLSGNGGLFAQVNGRTSKVLIEWLQAQDPDWLATITHISMDTSATYARAARLALPNAVVVVDRFHLVALANKAVTDYRRELAWALRGRRGRKCDPEWAQRNRLLRAVETLTPDELAKVLSEAA